MSFHVGLAAFFVFLLPLKFGSIVGVPEITLIWHSSLLWILETCPPTLFPIFSVLLLVSALVAGGWSIPLEFDNAFMISSLWLLLALASLVGFVGASALDFPITFSLHFLGLAIFAFAILITLRLSPGSEALLVRALILGACAASFQSLHQLLWGFRQSVEFVQSKELETGIKASRDLWLRLEQTRVFSPFSLCNSLAAHLILMIPVIFAGIFFDKKTARWAIAISVLSLFFFFFDNFGRVGVIVSVLIVSFLLALTFTSFFDDNQRMICAVFSIAFTVFLLFILKHTFSRGAVVAFGLALAALPFFLNAPRKIKFGYAALSLVVFAVFFAVVNQNREIFTMSSLHARFDYWFCAAEIFLGNFFPGTGWGDFFHEYTTIKNFPGTEAPHTAHNFVLDFASQCGVLGLISSCAIFAATILLLYRKTTGEKNFFYCRFDRLAILCGVFAWFLHSLTDINFQVPGTLASAIVLTLAALSSEKRENRKIPFAKFAIFLLALPVLFFSVKRLRGEIAFDRLREICEPVIIDSKRPEKYSPQAMEETLKAATEAMPYSPFPWASAGVYAQGRGNWNVSEKFFSEALKRSPERASFYYRLAISQSNLGKYVSAAENLRRASELFPNNEDYKQKYERMKNVLE